MAKSIREVHIKFERVQTWLFSIPRLRAMVGANVLLGEVLQTQLPELLSSGGGRWKIASQDKDVPKRHNHDPLGAYDDPHADLKLGITARHGGHFEAQLAEGAEAFAEEAAALLRRELPGLRFQIAIDDNPPAVEKGLTWISPELPVLAPCTWSGEGLASAVTSTGDNEEEASVEACRRQEAARRAERSPEDGKKASLANALTSLVPGKLAETFKELAGCRYMAVIHADGNGVGEGTPKDKSTKERSPWERVKFHHRNRVLIKRALVEALRACKDPTESAQQEDIAPLIPLMLGGDDLLVVCRATVALPFVVKLCAALEKLQSEEPLKPGGQRDFLLTLGIGVTFAPYTLPFHQLHQVAEALATSAKRKAEKKRHSVVDWTVFTSSWADKDLATFRRKHWLREDASGLRVLSRRPLPVLKAQGSLHTLEGLVTGAEALEKAGAPRSQLRYLVEQLGEGKVLAELAWHELSGEARTALREAGIKHVWEAATPEPLQKGTPMMKDAPTTYFTPLHDLVEVFEIPKLGVGHRGLQQDVQGAQP